jgi:hypothetical protein
MKKTLLTTNVHVFSAAIFLLFGFRSLAGGTDEEQAQRFPHLIQYELGACGFLPGDQIIISQVRGDREHIGPGGSYLVEGSYTLASRANADLALFCTSRGPSGPTPIQDGQLIHIAKGSGKFRLYTTNLVDGWLHLSLYPPNSSSRGGVYFGEKGNERSIMRDQDWFREFRPNSSSPSANSGVEDRLDAEKGGGTLDNKANRALLAYLGNPTPPPADMDSRYNTENLLKAFTTVCQKAELVITKLAVDDSEFPFLLYGTLAGNHPLPKAPVFEEQAGYTRGGSVRGSFGEESSYFAVNLVPDSQYPAGKEQACHRRLMLRLQMLADKVQQTEAQPPN